MPLVARPGAGGRCHKLPVGWRPTGTRPRPVVEPAGPGTGVRPRPAVPAIRAWPATAARPATERRVRQPRRSAALLRGPGAPSIRPGASTSGAVIRQVGCSTTSAADDVAGSAPRRGVNRPGLVGSWSRPRQHRASAARPARRRAPRRPGPSATSATGAGSPVRPRLRGRLRPRRRLHGHGSRSASAASAMAGSSACSVQIRGTSALDRPRSKAASSSSRLSPGRNRLQQAGRSGLAAFAAGSDGSRGFLGHRERRRVGGRRRGREAIVVMPVRLPFGTGSAMTAVSARVARPGNARRARPRARATSGSGSGAHDWQRASTSFQQFGQVYCRHDMQKLNVLWNASSWCAVDSRSVSLRAAAIASSSVVSSDSTKFFRPA